MNLGQIGALGGNVALIASNVENDGAISAPKGDVGLLAGRSVLVRDTSVNDGLFSILVGGPDTSLTHTGTIEAASAELRANGGNIYALAGNSGGMINATGVGINDGHVWLTAGDTGTLTANGSIRATQSNGDGGNVETSAGQVNFDGLSVDTTGTTGTTGTWLVDPYDLTVDTSAARTLSANLATTNVTLQTTATGASGPGNTASGQGDIIVSAPISWSSTNRLTLDAYHTLTIAAPITVAGAGGVVLHYNDAGTDGGYSFSTPGFTAGSLTYTGTGGSLNINGNAYTLLYSGQRYRRYVYKLYNRQHFVPRHRQWLFRPGQFFGLYQFARI